MNARPIRWPRALLLVGLVLSFAACALLESHFRVQVEFSDGKGLRAGDPVRFNGVDIGKVTDVRVTQDGAVVTLALGAKRVDAVQDNAAALIAGDAQDRRVEVYNPVATSDTVRDGAQLQGLESPLDLVVWKAGGAVVGLTEAVTGTPGELQDYFQSEHWNAAKKRMRGVLDALSDQSEDLIITLRKEFEALLDHLEEKGGETSQGIEAELDEISRRVSGLVRQFQDEGKDEIAEQLDQFSDTIHETIDRMQSQTD